MKVREIASVFLPVLVYLAALTSIREALTQCGWSEDKAQAIACCVIAVLLLLFMRRLLPTVQKRCRWRCLALAIAAGGCFAVLTRWIGGGLTVTRTPMVLTGVIAAGPVSEEVIYRGIVFRRSRESLGDVPAMILSSLLFAVGHMSPIHMVAAFFAGLLFSILYWKAESILLPMAAHMTGNLLTVLLLDSGLSPWLFTGAACGLAACLGVFLWWESV